MFRFLSLFSGIEAASVAWGPLGWKAAAFAEIEPFPCALLAHRYPDVPNLGDVTKYKEWPDLGTVDAVCGGSPCQPFSIAGLRQGLADPRGNLTLTFLGVVDKYQPRYVVWENVLGVLSSNGGRDFASFLGGLGQLGYGWCYRVLDAQYARVDGFPYAVPQRRRRVVLVGYLGDWRRAAAVLSEPESVLGDNPPRRQAGQAVAPTISSRPTGGGGLGTDFDLDGGLISSTGSVAHCLNAGGMGRQDYETETMIAQPLLAKSNSSHDDSKETYIAVAHALRADGFDASEDGTGRGTPIVPVANTLKANNGGGGFGSDPSETFIPMTLAIRGRDGQPDIEWRQDGTANAVLTPNGGRAGIGVGAIAFNPKMGGDPSMGTGVNTDGTAYTLDHSGGSNAVQSGWAVRRLTPTECERLMGFPDGYTDIPYRGKPAADGPRYKALGNSWAVNVFRWVGRRIELVEEVAKELNAA